MRPSFAAASATLRIIWEKPKSFELWYLLTAVNVWARLEPTETQVFWMLVILTSLHLWYDSSAFQTGVLTRVPRIISQSSGLLYLAILSINIFMSIRVSQRLFTVLATCASTWSPVAASTYSYSILSKTFAWIVSSLLLTGSSTAFFAAATLAPINISAS